MRKTLSLRLRITLVCAALLTLCCLLLTLTNNLSAMHLADAIQATPVFPAQSTGADNAQALPMTELAVSQPTSQARQTFRIQSLLAMAAILAAGILLIHYCVGKALAPLHDLTCQMRTRTAENLDSPVVLPHRNDEVGELARSFNQMSLRLNQVFVMQKNFSHNAAHEFRTPLAIIKTRTGLFRKKNPHPSPDTAELLAVIEGEVDRLSAIVGGLLDLTNLEQTACREPVPVGELMEEVAAEIASQASVRQISLQMDAAPRVLLGNRQLLHRALFNLVENAVKYSPEGGTVYIRSGQCQDMFRFTITDQGPGIPQSLREQIFEPFFRVDDARSRRQGGAGLGLALVRAIAQAHGGRVYAEDSEAGGSRFVLELPCKGAPAPGAAEDPPEKAGPTNAHL